jgi:Domain of unknown function (DUF4399)
LGAKVNNELKKVLTAVTAILGLVLGSAAAPAQGHDHSDQGAQSTQEAAPSADTGHTPAPKDAEVYFHYPLNGIRVPQRFTVRIGLRGMGVAPAGVIKPMTGHHHLLIDADNVDPSQPIPSDYNHVHLGNGQTEVVVTLPPGTHTLQLVLGDNAHYVHAPPVMSKKITVYVR